MYVCLQNRAVTTLKQKLKHLLRECHTVEISHLRFKALQILHVFMKQTYRSWKSGLQDVTNELIKGETINKQNQVTKRFTPRPR